MQNTPDFPASCGANRLTTPQRRTHVNHDRCIIEHPIRALLLATRKNSLYPHIVVHKFDPRRTDFEPYGLSCTKWQSTAMPRPNRHNEIELNFLPVSELHYLIGGRRLDVPRGTLSAFWAAIPHQSIPPIDDGTYYVATIPLNQFLQFDLPETFVQALLGGHVLMAPMDRVIPDGVARFESWTRDLIPRSSTILAAAAIHELQAMLLRFWSAIGHNSLSPSPHTALPATNASAVERMAAYIALHHSEPLTVDQISNAVGLAGGYAMSLFRKVFGQTMFECLLQHRLAHAQRLLISTDRQIVDLAFEAGFGSLSRFNAAFKQHCGCSPREYRNRHRNAGTM